MPELNYSHHGANSVSQQYQNSFQDSPLDQQVSTNSFGMMRHSYQMPLGHNFYLQAGGGSPMTFTPPCLRLGMNGEMLEISSTTIFPSQIKCSKCLVISNWRVQAQLRQ